MVIYYIKLHWQRGIKFIDAQIHKIQSNLGGLPVTESNRKIAHRNTSELLGENAAT